MVQLHFELPSLLAKSLQNKTANEQELLDKIVEFALLTHLDGELSQEKRLP